MSSEINPVRRNRQHRRGAVSMRLLTVVSWISLGAILLLCLLAGISEQAVHTDLQRTRQDLEQLRPPAAKLREVQLATAANRKMLSEFQTWSLPNRLPTYQMMRAVQENIPPQMVLYHFSAAINPAGGNDMPGRSLYLSGSAEDELIAIEAKRQLNADLRLRNCCGEIKLISSQRYSGKSWAFALEGGRLSGEPAL